MKKRQGFLFFAFTMLCVMFLFCACGKKVTFDPNGGEIVSGSGTWTYDGKTAVPAPEVKRDGYRFMGWDGDYENPEASLTVKAKWEKIYTVTFELDGGKVTNDVPCVQEVIASDEIRYPDVMKEGYAFDAWDSEKKTVESDTVIHASWRKLYTVTFELDGGEAEDPLELVQRIPEGGAAKAPKVSRDYMVFDSWDTAFDCVKSDITVTAKWEHRVLTNTEVFKYINPATVEVNSYRYGEEKYATGSGFFLTSDGEIVTNFHVIDQALRLTVKLSDGKELEVKKILAYDIQKDLAILKVDIQDAPTLDFAQKPIATGDAVYAIGSSLGLTGTFTNGIISTASRELDGVTYIQSTAAISAGNSGGPLVDETGCVIGVNTLTITNGQNLNFSIPVAEIATLKREPISVSAFAEKHDFTEYLFGEHFVQEDDTGNDYSCRILRNGDTVKVTVASGGDVDYFCVNSFDLITKFGKDAVVDVIYCIYIDDPNLLLGISEYTGLVSLNMRLREAERLDSDNDVFYTIESVGNQYFVFIYLHDLLKYDDGVTVPALQVAGYLGYEGNYQVYILAALCDEECPTKTEG